MLLLKIQKLLKGYLVKETTLKKKKKRKITLVFTVTPTVSQFLKEKLP